MVLNLTRSSLLLVVIIIRTTLLRTTSTKPKIVHDKEGRATECVRTVQAAFLSRQVELNKKAD